MESTKKDSAKRTEKQETFWLLTANEPQVNEKGQPRAEGAGYTPAELFPLAVKWDNWQWDSDRFWRNMRAAGLRR